MVALRLCLKHTSLHTRNDPGGSFRVFAYCPFAFRFTNRVRNDWFSRFNTAHGCDRHTDTDRRCEREHEERREGNYGPSRFRYAPAGSEFIMQAKCAEMIFPDESLLAVVSTLQYFSG